MVRTDLKTFLGSAMPNQCWQTVKKWNFRWVLTDKLLSGNHDPCIQYYRTVLYDIAVYIVP